MKVGTSIFWCGVMASLVVLTIKGYVFVAFIVLLLLIASS